MSAPQLVTRSVILVALIAAYVTLTVTGHDGNPVFLLIAGYIGGAGSEAVTTKRTANAVPAGTVDVQAAPDK